MWTVEGRSMSEQQPDSNSSYETECQRAELLGLQRPDEAEFERRRQARLEHEMAEQEAAEAVVSNPLVLCSPRLTSFES